MLPFLHRGLFLTCCPAAEIDLIFLEAVSLAKEDIPIRSQVIETQTNQKLIATQEEVCWWAQEYILPLFKISNFDFFSDFRQKTNKITYSTKKPAVFSAAIQIVKIVPALEMAALQLFSAAVRKPCQNT